MGSIISTTIEGKELRLGNFPSKMTPLDCGAEEDEEKNAACSSKGEGSILASREDLGGRRSLSGHDPLHLPIL